MLIRRNIIIQIIYYTVLFVITYPDLGFSAAHTGNAIADAFCNVIAQITGPIGKAVSSTAVIALGVGMYVGKTSIGLAFTICIGIALVFGAETVVVWISGIDGPSCVDQIGK